MFPKYFVLRELGSNRRAFQTETRCCTALIFQWSHGVTPALPLSDRCALADARYSPNF
jgi:hypothetical protein